VDRQKNWIYTPLGAVVLGAMCAVAFVLGSLT
jgi:hypothetical protein